MSTATPASSPSWAGLSSTLKWLTRATLIVLTAGQGALANLYLWQYAHCRHCSVLVGYLNQGAHWLTLLSAMLVVVTMLALRGKWRWLVLWVSPGATMFFVWYGAAWLPKPPRDAQGIEITVATFNIHQPESSADAILQVIDDLDTDIIAIQEARYGFHTRTQTQLGDQYPYQEWLVLTEDQANPLPGHEQLLILSRFPIQRREAVVNKPGVPKRLAPATYLKAEIQVHNRRVHVYVFHASRPAFDGLKSFDDTLLQHYVEEMVQVLAGVEEPVLFLCDCNSTPRSRQYATFNRILNEAFGTRGWGFGLTFPARLPLIRIDYVWYSENFTALTAGVWHDSGTSDHRPVWARLDLKR